MVSKGSDKYVIWPIYFDANVSRSKGRKVPKKLGIQNPSINDIFNVAKSLKLRPILEWKSHPSKWWIKGRILIDKRGKKTEILKEIAERL
jgi:signal recognition particle subunit SRP19